MSKHVRSLAVTVKRKVKYTRRAATMGFYIINRIETEYIFEDYHSQFHKLMSSSTAVTPTSEVPLQDTGNRRCGAFSIGVVFNVPCFHELIARYKTTKVE